jgi:hypothetical protein
MNTRMNEHWMTGKDVLPMDDVVGDDDGGERSVGECGCSDDEALEVA